VFEEAASLFTKPWDTVGEVPALTIFDTDTHTIGNVELVTVGVTTGVTGITGDNDDMMEVLVVSCVLLNKRVG